MLGLVTYDVSYVHTLPRTSQRDPQMCRINCLQSRQIVSVLALRQRQEIMIRAFLPATRVRHTRTAPSSFRPRISLNLAKALPSSRPINL